MRRAAFLLIAAALLPLSAAAQTPGPAGRSQGPMIVEPIHSGFLVAPDFKVTDVDHKTSELVGGYAGWQTDDTFFIGGAGYWLANGSHNDSEMAYGGLVAHWLANKDGRVGFGLRGLVGGGEATLTDSITIRVPEVRVNGRVVTPPSTALSVVRVRQGFVIGEPEALLSLRLTKQVRLVGGAGYRFTSVDWRGLDTDRLNGATGSLSLQIGGGS